MIADPCSSVAHVSTMIEGFATIQTDITPATREICQLALRKFPGKIVALGCVGDIAHSKRRSCHNPLYRNRRLIEGAKAVDVTPAGVAGTIAFVKLGDQIADELWKDHRVTVQIWRNRIRNREIDAGAWRTYNGPNRHDHHVHNSVECFG